MRDNDKDNVEEWHSKDLDDNDDLPSLISIAGYHLLPLGASLLKAVPDPPQLFCFKLLHQPWFIYLYISTRKESHLLQRQTTK